MGCHNLLWNNPDREPASRPFLSANMAVVRLLNAGQERLQYWTLEALVTCMCGLHSFCATCGSARTLAKLPSIFGGGIFAFSGYMLLQLQHFGLACGYAWMPLGLWSIDQAASSGHWRPLWKLVLASAMCFLAGYTPTWFVFCVAMGAYAMGSKKALRTTVSTAAALLLSVLIVMVQVLPAREAASMKMPELRYGSGIKELQFYASYFLPNYFDFAMDVPLVRRGEYLYIGAPAFLGLAYWLWRRRFRGHCRIVMLAVVLVLLTNPFSLVWEIVRRWSLLAEICRDWYFLAAVTLGIVPMAAWGLDGFLSRKPKPPSTWMTPVAIAALVLWSARLLSKSPGGGRATSFERAGRPRSIPPLPAALCHRYASTSQRKRVAEVLAIVLVLAVSAEYKAFVGTSKRFNARPGKYDKEFNAPFVGLDGQVYAEVRSHPEFRIAVDSLGPSVTMLRHYGLRTPQGFDPMLPAQYSEKMKEVRARVGPSHVRPGRKARGCSPLARSPILLHFRPGCYESQTRLQ